MSLWADYIREREGKEVLETEDGFVVYRFINEKVCYIVDIFVKAEARKSHKGAEMADQVCALAKKNGCVQLLGSVDPQANGATASLKVLLAYGMQLANVDGQMIYFVKEL